MTESSIGMGAQDQAERDKFENEARSGWVRRIKRSAINLKMSSNGF
jgi:hypothetical protein